MIRSHVKDFFLQIEKKENVKKEPKKKTKFQGVNSKFYVEKGDCFVVSSQSCKNFINWAINSETMSRAFSPVALTKTKLPHISAKAGPRELPTKQGNKNLPKGATTTRYHLKDLLSTNNSPTNSPMILIQKLNQT